MARRQRAQQRAGSGDPPDPPDDSVLVVVLLDFAHPILLGAVAASRAALHPDEPAWTDLRIVRQATVVVDKVPTGEVVETVLAEWSADGEAQP